MNGIPKFDQARGEAVRTALLGTVDATARRRLRPAPSRWFGVAAFTLAGVVTGGAVSAAALSNESRVAPAEVAAPDAVPAPPGTVPGQPIISLLGDTISQTTTGTFTIDLPDPPDSATHLRVTIQCLTPGTTTWGIDPAGNDPQASCSPSDIGAVGGRAWSDFALPATMPDLSIRAGDGISSIVTYQFVRQVPTALGRTTDGDSFGAESRNVHPDLVAVIGLDPSGQQVQGYARATDLDAFGPDWPDQPSTPAEALEWQRQRAERYPDGWVIPVYAADGTTRIGTFQVSN